MSSTRLFTLLLVTLFSVLSFTAVQASSLNDLDSSLAFNPSFETEAWPQPEAIDTPMVDENMLRHQEHMFSHTLTGGVDPCVNNPCQNNATCFTLSTVGAGMYTCYCAPGWQGVNCTIPVATSEVLLFESPYAGMYSGVQGQAQPIALNGTRLIQGQVNAGNIIKVFLTSNVRTGGIVITNSFTGEINTAGNTAAPTGYSELPFNTTVSYTSTLDQINALLNSLLYFPAEYSALPIDILRITASDYRASVSGGLGTPLKTTNITIRAQLTPPPGYQGIQLLGPAQFAATESTPVAMGSLGYDILNADILNNLKVNAVSVRVTSVNGSFSMPNEQKSTDGTQRYYYGFAANTGRLEDMSAYLREGLYRPNPNVTLDTLTFLLGDSLNTSTYIVRVAVTLRNRAPVVSRLGAVVPAIFDDAAVNITGFSFVDLDSPAGAQFTVNATAAFGSVAFGSDAAASAATVTDTLTAVNARLATLRYVAVYGNVGTDNITICVNDNAVTAAGGARSTCVVAQVRVDYRILAPLQPNPPRANRVLATSALLSWGPANSSDPHYGNQTAYRYQVQLLRFSNDGSAFSYFDIYNGTATSFNITGLTPNTLYLMQVRVFNSAGVSAYSAQTITDPATYTSATDCGAAGCSGFMTMSAPPSTIRPTASALSDTAVQVNWTAPASNGGTAITAYTLRYRAAEYRPEGRGLPFTGVCTLNTTVCIGSIPLFANQFTYTVTGLQASLVYYFTVEATNAAGAVSFTDFLDVNSRALAITLSTAPVIVSFVAADGANANTPLYHAGNFFTITFDVATNQPTITANSFLFSEPVGILQYTWISSTVLRATVTSTNGASPRIGSLTVTPTVAANIVRQVTVSLPATATSPPLTGTYGSIVGAPIITAPFFNASGFAASSIVPFRFNLLGGDIVNRFTMLVSASSPNGAVISYVPIQNLAAPGNSTFQGITMMNGTSTAVFIGTTPGLTFFANNGLRYFSGGFASAAGSITVTLTINNILVAQQSTTLRLLASNRPPSVVVSGNATSLPVDTFAPLTGVSIDLVDPDFTSNPLAPVSVSLSINYGKLSLDTLSLNVSGVTLTRVSDSAFTLAGPMDVLRTALNTLLRVAIGLPTTAQLQRTQLRIVFDDLANGGGGSLVASAVIDLVADCSAADITTPVFTGAIFADNLVGVFVALSSPIGAGVIANPVVPCSQVFSAATMATLGTNPICNVSPDYDAFFVVFGSDATLLPGQNVSSATNSPILKRCASSNVSSPVSTALVRPPLAPITPSVAIAGTAVLSFCPNTMSAFSAVNIDGFGSRAATYTWSLSDSNVTGPGVNFAFNGDLITPGNTAVVSVNATNFVGASSVTTLTIRRAFVSSPLLTGSTTRTITANTNLFLSFDVSLPACLNTTNTTTAINYRWTVAPNAAVDASTVNSQTLRVPPNTLPLNSVYTFTLTATIDGTSAPSQNSIRVFVADRPLTAVVDGGSSRTISTASANTFTAATSSIPVAAGSSAVYTWTCADIYGAPCFNAITRLPFTALTGASITVPANSQLPGTYFWTLTISFGTQSDSATTRLEVVANPAALSVRLNPSPLILNTRSILRIAATLPSTQSSLYNYEWSVIRGALPALTSVQRTQPVLVLNQNQNDYFQAGITYTFRLTVSLKTDPLNTVSNAEVEVYTNIPPTGGAVSATPTIGTAGTTTFTITARDFKDSEGNVPLTYQYFYQKADGSANFLSGEVVSPVFTTTLPVGSTLNNGQLVVGVKVLDSIRGYVMVTSTVTVNAPAVTPTAAQIVAQFFATISGSTDGTFIIAQASTTGALLNTLTPSGEDQSVPRGQVLNAINAFLNQVPVALSLQAITNIIGTDNVYSQSVLQLAIDQLNVLLTYTANDPASQDDRSITLAYLQLYQNIIFQSNPNGNTAARASALSSKSAARRLLATGPGICCTSDAQTQRQALAGIVSVMRLISTNDLKYQDDYANYDQTDQSLIVYRGSPIDPVSTFTTIPASSGVSATTLTYQHGSNYIVSGLPANTEFVDIQLLQMRGPKQAPNPYSGLQNKVDGLSIVAPVVYFDLVNATGYHLNVQIATGNSAPMIKLPLTQGATTANCNAQTNCVLACVAWDDTLGYTTEKVGLTTAAISAADNTVSCRVTSTPMLVSVQAFGSVTFGPSSSSTASSSSSADAIIGSSSTANNGIITATDYGFVGYQNVRSAAGYYVLGAIACVAVLAFVAFAIVHKEEDQKSTSSKLPEHPQEQAEMAVLPSAKSAPASDDVPAAQHAAPVEETQPQAAAASSADQPTSYQYVMDYKSVFALKHNVLENKSSEDAAALDDAPVDDKNVHFVLHE